LITYKFAVVSEVAEKLEVEINLEGLHVHNGKAMPDLFLT
jgi:hypothetical protein